jgi:hypothetical protein
MYVGLHVKYRYSCQILMKLNFFDRLSKNIRILNFMKILAVGAEFHAKGQIERRTDTTQLIVAFRDFAYSPKNSNVHHLQVYLSEICFEPKTDDFSSRADP